MSWKGICFYKGRRSCTAKQKGDESMPSIVDGLFAGRSGIQSHGTAISVLADNIANQNTTGFKQSRADFSDLLAGTIGGGAGATTVGSGSEIGGVTPILTQGSFEATGRGLDVGIDGNGFFIVQDTSSGQRFYTRAGNFQTDPSGNLLDQNGNQVLGFASTGNGGLEPLNVNQQAQSNVATTDIDIAGNLDASQPVVANPVFTPGTTTFTDLSNDAQFSTFVDVFDSLGESHTVTMYFYHTTQTTGVGGQSTWTVQAVVDGAEIDGGTAGSPSLLGTSTITFDGNGVRTGLPLAGPDFTLTPTWAGGAAPSNITATFDPMTQFSTVSNISAIDQNGNGTGSVVSFEIEPDGNLFAQLDNGETSTIGTIGLAIFANPEGLDRVGNSLFIETTTSGEPVAGEPGSGTFGELESGALELSNADIASDFVKLISIQRGFQASSRIITNIDDLLNDIINLA